MYNLNVHCSDNVMYYIALSEQWSLVRNLIFLLQSYVATQLSS